MLFGHTGMLGWYVHRWMRRLGWSVIVMGRNELLEVESWVGRCRPDVMINCICSVQGDMTVNYELPIRLSGLGVPLVHISTNGVFSGERGGYIETDIPDAVHAYGMSKRKGEKIVATIIRTSIIGESDRSTSYFLEWVKGSVGVISGYTDHTWNGVTCLYLAQFISFIIREGLLWTGVRHLCERGRIYSKHWLAVLIKRFYYLPVTIIPQHTSPKYLDLNTCYNNSYKPPCLVMDLMEQRVFTLVEKKGFGKYVSRLTCRFCNNYTKDILHLGDHFGLAGGFLSNVNEEDKTYPLTLSLCEKCKYIQCKQVIPSDQLFKKNYFYYSSMIPSLVKHFKGLADWIAQNFPKESKIIEIGCNDGVLLYPLYERGFTQVIGVDPSRTITNVSKNITCYNSYFDNETVDKILTNHGLQDLFISCNSFAHIDNMQEILYNMKRVLQPGCGKAMIEVHYAKHIFTEKQFDFIYHEHTGYYTVSSLFHICKMNDLRLSYVEHVPNHGGSLRCIIEMKPTVMVPEHIEKWLKEEAELFEENFFIHRKNNITTN